jgi:hypothetical protein
MDTDVDLNQNAPQMVREGLKGVLLKLSLLNLYDLPVKKPKL